MILADNAKNLNAVKVTGPGASIPCAGCREFSLQVVFTSNPNPIIVTLEGSNDGATWFTLATWTTLATGALVYAVDTPCNYVRSNLTTLTGGTNPTVSTYITGV